MSSYELLGRDEQASGLFPFVAPTDYQKVVLKLQTALADQGKYKAWDSQKTHRFVRDLMRIAKDRKVAMDDPSAFMFYINDLQQNPQYDYDFNTQSVYLRTMLDLAKQGEIPATINKPWDYEATTVAEDVAKLASNIGKGAGEGAKKAMWPLALVIVAGIGAYAFFGGGYAKAPGLLKRA